MLAPFSHYLQSNQAPSENEVCKIKALRANPLQEISSIDVEIEQFEGILNSLKRKRAHIQKSIDDCDTILAPVRRLPIDVLGVIFSYCLVTHRDPIISPIEAPILLTHICHDWRSIALSIPRLWSRFYIPLLHKFLRYQPGTVASFLESEEDHRMEARSEEVQRWLRLSAACPLSITIMPTGEAISHPQILDIILQSSRRWQQLELGFLPLDSNISHRLFSLSADDLCMLREVRFHVLQNSRTNMHMDDIWYKSGLLTAPGLRSISIAEIHPTSAFPAGIPPNWKNLSRLFIHSPVLLVLANQILNCCCNMVACLLNIAHQWDDIDPIFHVSTALPSFPHLTFLCLHGDVVGCRYLFGNIEAPSLQILDYPGYFPSEPEEFGLSNFFQSITSLRTLRIDYYNLTGDNLLKYYTHISSVTHLVLGRSTKRYRYFASDDALDQQFNLMQTLFETRRQSSPDSTSTVLFPWLEVFEAYDISSVTDSMLLEYIVARIDATRSNTGVSKLRKVLVEFSRTRQTDIVPEALDYAKAAGIELELDLTYYTGKEVDVSWSPSFGLSADDLSWTYPLYDY